VKGARREGEPVSLGWRFDCFGVGGLFSVLRYDTERSTLCTMEWGKRGIHIIIGCERGKLDGLDSDGLESDGSVRSL
jgi:hypothetical protein